MEERVKALEDCTKYLQARMDRLPQFIKVMIGVIVVFFIAIVVTNISQHDSAASAQKKNLTELTKSQRQGCIRGARRVVDGLNRDYAIYMADVTATEKFRHDEAESILSADLDIASSLDVVVLTRHPKLTWPAMRDRVAATGFQCSQAYPDPGQQ